MPTKVVFYGRYSSTNQTEQSIEGQLHVCEKYAAEHDMIITQHYIDRAISGTSDHRPDFQRMIEDSASHAFEAVLVYKLDRFARDRYDSAIYKKKLRENGVRVISATENISDGPEGQIMEALIEAMDQHYSADLSRKCKRGLQESFNKGYFIGGYPPYGYKVVDRRLAIDEDKAPIVREIYRRFASGDRYRDILVYLNSHAIMNNNGNPWSYTNLSITLHSRIYIGEYHVGSMEGVMPCPAIIEKEVFDKVQENSEIFRKRRRERRKSDGFLLTGKLRCSKCGYSICGTGNDKANRKYYYYSCSHCGYCVRSTPLEEKVMSALREYLTEEKVQELASAAYKAYEAESDAPDERMMIRNQLTGIERKIENGINAILNGMDSTTFKEKLAELEWQRDELQKQLDEMEGLSTAFTEEDFQFILSEIVGKVSDAENDKRLIDTVVNRIIIHDKDTAIICINLTNEANEPPLEQILVSLSSPSASFREMLSQAVRTVPNISRAAFWLFSAPS